MAKKKMGQSRPEFPAAYKLAVVEAPGGVDEADVARRSVFRSRGRVAKRYRDEGPIGLESRRSGPRPSRKTSNPVKRERVVTRRRNTRRGTRRIRDVLARFEALGVSGRGVGFCAEEGLIETPTPKVDCLPAVRAGGTEPTVAVGHLHVWLRRAKRLYVRVHGRPQPVHRRTRWRTTRSRRW